MYSAVLVSPGLGVLRPPIESSAMRKIRRRMSAAVIVSAARLTGGDWAWAPAGAPRARRLKRPDRRFIGLSGSGGKRSGGPLTDRRKARPKISSGCRGGGFRRLSCGSPVGLVALGGFSRRAAGSRAGGPAGGRGGALGVLGRRRGGGGPPPRRGAGGGR